MVGGRNQYSKTSEGERGLWVAVVLQALEDIEVESYHSVDYTQSVLFFLGTGPWSQWRMEVAAMLDLHGDDLARVGRAGIAARHLREPPPPPTVVVRRAPPRPEPAPLVARPAVVRRIVEPAAKGGHRRTTAVDRTGAWLKAFIESSRRVA